MKTLYRLHIQYNYVHSYPILFEFINFLNSISFKVAIQHRVSSKNFLGRVKIPIQEVPAFRDFWFQRVIMKCGDYEFRGQCKTLKWVQKILKVHFWSLFSKIPVFNPASSEVTLHKIFKSCFRWSKTYLC